jgi:DNA-binding transcriptional regulator YdaS (Cro superfamily)
MGRRITPFEALERVVEAAGSQAKLGRALGVSSTAVWKWVAQSRWIPGEYVLMAEELYGVSRHDLRPDLYPRNYPPAPEYRSEGDGEHRLCGAAK